MSFHERKIARLAAIAIEGDGPALADLLHKRNRLMSGAPAGPKTVK